MCMAIFFCFCFANYSITRAINNEIIVRNTKKNYDNVDDEEDEEKIFSENIYSTVIFANDLDVIFAVYYIIYLLV